MTIDLGLSYEEAGEAAQFVVLPVADYDFQVEDVEEEQTQEGRPMFVWNLRIINHPDPNLNGTPLFYRTPLTYMGPAGVPVTKGIGLLYALAHGVGYKWEGTAFDEAALRGKTGRLAIRHRGYCTTCQKAQRPGVPCPICGQMVDPRHDIKTIYPK